MSDVALEVFGWIGSGLVVWSLMQARVLRFRWMNLAGALIAGTYNAVIGIWPFVVMNYAIAIIDIYWLRRLYNERHDPAVYRVITMPSDSPYLAHVMEVHAADIAEHAPAFALAPDPARTTFLVVRGDEPVGIVAVRDEGGGIGLIELDWVKKRFRDFTPGEFIYTHSGAMAAAGFSRLEVAPHEATDVDYLGAMGFRQDNERWVREVTA